MSNFKLNTIGTNKQGTKIFCKLKYNNKINLVKGYYDFNKEKFIITKYQYDNINIINTLTKNKLKKILQQILTTNYDWNL